MCGGDCIATTRLMPLHIGKGRTVARALGRVTAYVENPDKTDGGELISSYQCNADIADKEFLFAQRQYENITGRKPKKNDVIAYHLRQSFKPGEVSPERANKIGYELAMRLTKGHNPFIVCTHIDKAHIHSHIIFSSINLDCTRKFRNFWRSSFAIRKISDILCLENGLSVIAEPQASRGSYADWLKSKGINKPPTVRRQLEQIIDDKIAVCKDFNSFMKELQAAGIEIKQGKNPALKLPEAKRFVRLKSLGDAYSEAAIKARIVGQKTIAIRQEKPNLLIDIQAKMQQANSPGYERWAKKFNLKEMAKTVMYLQENGLLDYAVLQDACADASEKYNVASEKTKANSERMKEISELQKHIGAYRKNRDIYIEYRKK